MGRIGRIGVGFGTSGFQQESIEQLEYEEAAAESELMEAAHNEYLRDVLRKDAPIQIPENATIKEETKNGYIQVKYTWEKGEYKYESRWHTKTPDAPDYQGTSWVVTRTKPGIGAGPDARPKEECIMVRTNDNGAYTWVSKKIWNAAIRARKNGTCTKEQKELLDNGHWKSNE